MKKKLIIIIQQLVPSIYVSAYYFLKYKAKVSLKSEVDLTSQITFGKNCVVSSFTKIKGRTGSVSLGDNSGFATGCFISAGKNGIQIGKNAFFGPNVSVTSSNYVFNKLHESVHTSRGIKIGNNVLIGANCSILDGAEISDNTIVNANTVINRKFKPNVVLSGNPAKVVYEIKETGHSKKGEING
ncbi:MAG: acyltransferase [Planctomycetes bacterium]|nr:acyltransferase [Planctomycetota bacterium]